MSTGSGVAIDDEVMQTFNDIKMGHKYSYVTYKINDDNTKIIVDKAVEDKTSWADFVGSIQPKQALYAVYDFPYVKKDGVKDNKLVFISFIPDDCKIKSKMIYSSSKDALKKKLTGVKNVQANDKGDLDEAEIIKILNK